MMRRVWARPAFAAPLAPPHRGAAALDVFSRSSRTKIVGTPWPLENPHVRLIAGRALPPQKMLRAANRPARLSQLLWQRVARCPAAGGIQILPRQSAGGNLSGGQRN